MTSLFTSFFGSSGKKKGKLPKETDNGDDYQDAMEQDHDEDHEPHPLETQQPAAAACPMEDDDDDDQLETQQPGMMETMATMMPPPAVAQQQQQDHVQFRDHTTMPFSSADEAAALAVQPPELNFNRLRSMSRVFTTLPPVLPTYQQMVADQMEYLCHLMLLETMPDRVLQYKKDYECVLRNFSRTTDGPKLLKTPGRLHSRMLLAALAADLFLVREEDEKDEAIKVVSPASVTADDWNMLREQLIHLKGVLLQQNANNAVLSSSTRKPALPDTELEKHEMMNVDYREVLQLLEVQRAMAALREGLQSIEDDDDDEDNFATQAAAAASPPRTPTSPRVKRAVEQVVSQYMTNLTNIFPVETAPAETNKKDEEEDDDDDFGAHEEDEDDLTMDCSLRSVTANIPKELNSFVLTDLYHPKTQSMPAEEGMVDRLLEHVRSITEDTLTPTGTAPGRYSYANLLQKVRRVYRVLRVLHFYFNSESTRSHFCSLSFFGLSCMHSQARALLIKWSESILEIPALVQLGYGGVTSPIVHNDRDDVSSWGGDGVGLDPHQHTLSEGGSVGGSAAANHHLHRRSRSMMRLLDASRRGRSISVTEEEREIVAQLAKITGATTNHKNVVAAAAEEHATEDASTQTLRLRKHSKKKALPAGAVSRLKDPPATARPEASKEASLTEQDASAGQEGAKEKEVAPPKLSEKVDEAKKPEAASATKRSRTNAKKKAEEAKKRTAAPAAKGGGSKKKEAETKLNATKEAKKPAAAPADIDSSSDSDSSYEQPRNVQRLHRIVFGAAKDKKPVATAKPVSQPAPDSPQYSSEDSPRKHKLERLSVSADRKNAASQQRKHKRATLLDDDSSSSDSDKEAASRRRKTDKDRSDKKRARSSSDASKENVASPSTKKNGSASKKQKVQRLEWGSDDDEYPEPAPAKRPRRAPGNGHQHRRAFTKDEEDGLRDGVRRWGVGHWKEIQENEPRLRGRDNHQIKDKYRNMLRNGEI